MLMLYISKRITFAELLVDALPGMVGLGVSWLQLR